MEKIKITKEDLSQTKDSIIFVLLFCWLIMPILLTIKPLYNIFEMKECYFALMKIIGGVGITFSVFNIYDKIKNSKDKKTILKEILPIFIFILYMGWTLVACHLSPNKQNAFNGHFYRKEGYFMYINYAGYFLCAFLLKDKKLKRILLNTFVIASIFLISISRITKSGKELTDIFINTRIDITVFAQFNHYGYYLMMSAICCLGLFLTDKNKIIKVLHLVAYAVIGYATIYNDTFGCYLAVAGILILYGIYALIKKADRKDILIAITIFAILSCIVTKNNKNLAFNNISQFAFDIKSIVFKIIGVEGEEVEENFENAGTTRMQLWINGIKFVSKRPIIGYGPDNLRPYYAEVNIPQDRPHNLLIYLSAVSGIPGMLIYVTAVGIIVIKGIKRLFSQNREGLIYLIIIITYLISAMFANSMYYISPYFFIFLGSLMHCNFAKKEE